MSIACYTNKKTLMHFKCSYKIRLLYIVRDFYRFLEQDLLCTEDEEENEYVQEEQVKCVFGWPRKMM